MRQRLWGCFALVSLSACHRDWDFSHVPSEASWDADAEGISLEASNDTTDATLADASLEEEPGKDSSGELSDALGDPLADESLGCASGDRRCVAGLPEECSQGAWSPLSPCPGATPHCIEKGECVACTLDTHCVGTACLAAACGPEHACVSVAADAGTFVAAAPGSCTKTVCDGDGGTTTVADPQNFDDKNECTEDACNGMTPSHTPTPKTPCGTNGVCDLQGVCAKIVTGCGDMSGLLELSPWPMAGYCPTRVGRSPYVGPKHLSIKVSSDLIGGSWGGGGVLDTDSTIYFSGSATVRLRAMAPSVTSLPQLWDFPPVVGAVCAAIAADRTIYAPESYSGNATLYAVTPGTTGATLKWTLPLGGSTISCPVVGADGTLYLGAGHDLVAINSTGTEKWRYPTSARIYMPTIALDGTVLVGGEDHNVYAFNPASPTPIATFSAQKSISAGPVVGPDGTVYVGSSDKNLYALDSAKTLEPKSTTYWFATGHQVIDPAVAEDGTLFFGSWDGYVYAVRWEGDQFVKKWDFLTCGTPRGNTFLGADGTVYVAVHDACSRLYALDPVTGAELSHVDETSANSGITQSGLILGPRGNGANKFWLRVIGEQ